LTILFKINNILSK